MEVSSGPASSSRLARTVHCSRPRETPPKPSMMPRLWYLPRPKSTCRDPSVRAIDVQIFSAQARSDSATVANVSAIWWFSPSSARRSAPISLKVIRLPFRVLGELERRRDASATVVHRSQEAVQTSGSGAGPPAVAHGVLDQPDDPGDPADRVGRVEL